MSAVMMKGNVATIAAAGLMLLSVACRGSDTAQAADGPATVLVSPENIVVVT